MTATADAVVIAGRTLRFPIEVRDASSWAAIFSVDAAAAQRLVEPAGLRVARTGPGRTLVTLVFADYRDGDLDAYHEFGVSFLVHPHEGASRLDVLRNRAGVYIHRLPVDRTFTLHAGREIWGYPKTLAEIDIRAGDATTVCTLGTDGEMAVRLTVASRGRVPMPRQSPPTYTFLDGVLRRTEWEVATRSYAARRGSVELGSGEIADELRSLGLPKKPVLVLSQPDFRVRFGPSQILSA
ncbi:MAG: acetoacetate decarboxylase family protein [Actinomycetota bacterium]